MCSSDLGEIHIGEQAQILRGGDAALVPKGVVQWIKNIGKTPLTFYVIVSPPWDEKQEEVF